MVVVVAIFVLVPVVSRLCCHLRRNLRPRRPCPGRRRCRGRLRGCRGRLSRPGFCRVHGRRGRCRRLGFLF